MPARPKKVAKIKTFYSIAHGFEIGGRYV